MTPKGRRRIREWSPYAEPSPFGIADVLVLVCLLAGGLCLFWFAQPEYRWSWGALADFLVRATPEGFSPGLLVRGLGVTVRLGLWAMLLALVIGVPLGIAAARRRSLPIQIFVNLARNTPPLVLLFLFYFFAGNLLPTATLEQALRTAPSWLVSVCAVLVAPEGQLDRMLAAVLTLGLYEGAYVAEIVRGGIESVHPNQWEASAALGFSRFQQLRLVILPQAMPLLLPPLTGQFISTFKDSALAALISLPDLTFQALEVMAISRMTFEVWLSAGVLYLVIGVLCAALGRWLERRGKAWRNA